MTIPFMAFFVASVHRPLPKRKRPVGYLSLSCEPSKAGVDPGIAVQTTQGSVIENRPGANTNLDTTVVTKAEADGHTLLFTTDGTFIFNPLIYSSMPFYTVSELAPVSLVATASSMFAIGTHVPVKNGLRIHCSGEIETRSAQLRLDGTRKHSALADGIFRGRHSTQTRSSQQIPVYKERGNPVKALLRACSRG
jgi:hypothetical protein